MNLGQPRGPIGRWAVRPVSRPLIVAAVVSTGLILAVTRPPIWWRETWFVDLPYFARWGDWQQRWAAAGPIDVTYALGLVTWTLVLAGWWLGAAIRWLALLRFRTGVPSQPPRRHALLYLLLTLSVLMVGLAWPYRMGKAIVRQAMAAAAATTAPSKGTGAGINPAARMQPSQHARALWAVALQGSGTRERLTALQLLANRFNDQMGWVLADALSQSAQPAMRIWQLRLFGLYGPAASSALAEKYLDDPNAEVRAAAADAAGLLHGGLDDSQVTKWVDDPVATQSDPPVQWSLIKWNPRPGVERRPRLELPQPVRQRLSEMIVSGATTEEREAAARTLVEHAPPGYRLRVAEWGVWQAQSINGDGRLTAQLSEIPPLAHAVGDTTQALSARNMPRPTIIWKPVIHLSTNTLLAVDLRVKMLRGRPWYVYPMPDDFDLTFSPRGRGAYNFPNAPPVVRQLDPTGLKPLNAQLREGYPWLTPTHLNHRPGAGSALAEVGFRWQSLIVSPTKLGWMHEAPVGDDARFAWWKRLRDVDCAWVSNRGESERFLYYDGPTLIGSSVEFTLDGQQLRARAATRPTDAETQGYNSRPTWTTGFRLTRDALLVRVANGTAHGERLDVPVDARDGTIDLQGRSLPNGAENAFKRMLRERGLTPGEAAGMLAAWQETFFKKEGARLLIMMSQSDYDSMCPLSVRPQPTEITRVGVIWVEFN
jgi:hypothetical protein